MSDECVTLFDLAAAMLGHDIFTGQLSGKGVKGQLLGGSQDLATPPA
ncbi:hypothetical protein [Vreelandella populi]|nr:hypothetical protein [Halomonas populi]